MASFVTILYADEHYGVMCRTGTVYLCFQLEEFPAPLLCIHSTDVTLLMWTVLYDTFMPLSTMRAFLDQTPLASIFHFCGVSYSSFISSDGSTRRESA